MGKPIRGYDRGKIERHKLKRPITFNGCRITDVVIEIDHINFGLNTKTKALNSQRRSSFTVREVEQFIMQLDGEDILADDYTGMVSHFSIRIDCPVRGPFKGDEFLMIFDTDHTKPTELHTITLYRKKR